MGNFIRASLHVYEMSSVYGRFSRVKNGLLAQSMAQPNQDKEAVGITESKSQTSQPGVNLAPHIQ